MYAKNGQVLLFFVADCWLLTILSYLCGNLEKVCMNIVRTILLLVFAWVLAVAPAEARKKPNKYDLKREHASYLPLIEPDPVNRKSKPDSAPRALQDVAIADGGGGVQARRSRGGHEGNYPRGIDVSHYQGYINWAEAARDAHVQFVYLKATEGSNYVDDTYQTNLREAHRHGLKVGPYHFFRPNVDADAQFRNMVSVVDKRHIDLLPMIDVEVQGGVSMATFHARLERLLELVTKEYGKRPIIYTGKNFYNKYMYGGRYSRYKFWIAAYSFEEPMLYDDDDYLIWQYSGSGSVRGIRGNVDMNRFVGNHQLKEIFY